MSESKFTIVQYKHVSVGGIFRAKKSWLIKVEECCYPLRNYRPSALDIKRGDMMLGFPKWFTEDSLVAIVNHKK